MRIARGVTRTVVVGRRYTVKFPCWRRVSLSGRFAGWCHGYLANVSERFWGGESFSRGVNPVLWHIGPINVYRTCEPVMLPDDYDYDSITDMLIKLDRKPENVGIHPELGLVWIDYG